MRRDEVQELKRKLKAAQTMLREAEAKLDAAQMPTGADMARQIDAICRPDFTPSGGTVDE